MNQHCEFKYMVIFPISKTCYIALNVEMAIEVFNIHKVQKPKIKIILTDKNERYHCLSEFKC